MRANDDNDDGGPLTISSASDPANGTVVLTGGSPGAHTGLTYQPDPNYCNNPPGTTPDTFTYTLNGGSTATVTVTVDCAPDDPVVDTSAGSTSYTENAAATVIDVSVTVSDPDAGTTIIGAAVKITGNFAGAEDVLALAGVHPGITASLSGDTLTLTGNASPAAYQAALRDVTYRNSSDSPSTLARTVTFTVTDDTARTGSDTKGVTVVAVDDPPMAVNDSATVLEDAAATAVPVLTNDTDVDAGPKTISSVTQPANGTVVITGGGTGLTYQPNPNYCNDPPGTSPDTFTYTLNGGSSATVSMTVTCVNDAPVADDETFTGNDSAIGNTAMVVNDPDDAAPNPAHPKTTVTGDILAGDTDIDGPGPLTVTPGTFATNDGGSVTIEADGDFTFHPAADTSCTDTSDFFDYTVEDSGSPELTDTGRVTIAIAGCVWYVRNNAPAGGGGTSAAPFDALVEAETASGANHTVFVFDGDNTATGLDAGGYAMNAGERLIGEHEGLVVDPDGGGALTADTLHPANPGAHPTLTANGADVIDLDDGNEVRGFNIDPQGSGGGIAGTAGDTGGGMIDDVNVVDTIGAAGAQAGLELNGTTGTFNISNFTSNNNATGVLLNNAGTANFTPAGTITITSAGAPGLAATNTNMGTSTFDAITVTGSATGGVSITNPTNPTPGTTTFGDLSLTTTGGTGFLLNNAGTVSVPAAGTANVNATGGPAVDVTGTAGATLAFDDVDSTNSTGDGVNLAGLGAGTFTANSSSTITNAATIDFDLDGGSGAITYDGTITDDVGQLVRVANTGGGTKDFNGNITDGGDGDGSGIALTSNTGATIRFDGGVTLATGANAAFAATGGGTVAVTDPAGATTNTLATTTDTALNIANTSIHADGATFQSIASNGAARGIVLNTTGSSGGLTVTGTGTTDGSGGTIQNTTTRGASIVSASSLTLKNMNFTNAATADFPASPTGLSLGNNTTDNAAIHLQTTNGATLDNLNVTGSAEHGINAHSVNNLTLQNSVLSGLGNAADEDGIHAYNLSGTTNITSTSITSSGDDNLNIQNNTVVTSPFSHTGTINVTGGSFNTGALGSGVLFGIRGTWNTTVNVSSVTINNNFSGGVVADTFDTATSDIEVTGSTITNNNDAIAISANNGNTDFDVHDNANLSGQDFVNISVLKAAFSTTGSLEGRIRNNPITTENGHTADGITVFNAGGGPLNTVISGNTLDFAGTQRAINIQSGQDGPAAVNATVTGNTIDIKLDGVGNAVNAILANSQVADPSGAGSSLCADIGGAGALANTFTHSLGGTLAGGDIRVRQRFGANVRLPGYGGGATDTAAVSAYLDARNAEVSPSTATVQSGSFSGGAACTQPTP